MQVRTAKVAVFIAMALVLNHARCVAACVVSPCVRAQQPSCHHHQSPETKADRGCAFPATNAASSVAVAPDAAVASAVAVITPTALPTSTPLLDDAASDRPPGSRSISILRV
jgi:hypothetical protein